MNKTTSRAYHHINAMQRAVDIVHSSPHPVNKIAASLSGEALDGHPYLISATNHWPDSIQDRLGTDISIGNASGTVHAETACILQAPYTQGAAIYITDPFCPNCAKNMAEAGITQIYIDHKGFDKDFAERRGGHFQSMSLEICARAGIAIYEIRRKAGEIVEIQGISPDYTPADDSPVHITTAEETYAYSDFIRAEAARYGTMPYACINARNISNGEEKFLSACAHPVIGYSLGDEADHYTITHPPCKYSYMQEPVNRILMTLRRHGYKADWGSLYSSQMPTSREQVNMVAAGIQSITVGDMQIARDNSAFDAQTLLSTHNILKFLNF